MDRRPSPARLLRRTPLNTWQDILPELERRLGMSADRRTLRLWVLVLDSRSVPNRPDYGGSRRSSWLGRPEGEDDRPRTGLYVPAAQEDRALDEIAQYVRENSGVSGRMPIPQPPARAGFGQTLFVLAALALFHAFVSRTSSAGPVGLSELDQAAKSLVVPWVDLGASDCFRIRVVGEWWRAVTALTLHADAGHLLANCLFGGLFFYMVTRRVGAALGWWAILLSGILGNLVNCRVQGYDHLSLGASTAVLGAVGVLAGIGAADAASGMWADGGSQLNVWQRAWRGVLLPLAMGVALLAFLGSGKGNIDLGAHLFGFFCGILPGVAAGWLSQTGRVPPKFWDRLIASFAFVFVVLCWGIAVL